MIYTIGILCLLNLIFTALIGMNIIQLREVIQEFIEGPPIIVPEKNDAGLADVKTPQIPYTVEPMIEE